MVRHTNKAMAAVMAGLLALSTVAPAAALAENNTPSAGDPTDTGQTSLTMILQDTGEHGYGDNNLTFMVPSAINFVLTSDGELIGPEASEAYIQNNSGLKAHVSSVEVKAESDWNLVSDVTGESAENSVDFKIGPSGSKIDGSAYTSKTTITDTAWNMDEKDGSSDKIELSTSGHAKNVTKDITSATQFAVINWYVAPGNIS